MMSKKDLSSSMVNVSEKTERERLVIAKEVVIKSLLPVVFANVKKEEREATFDKWYSKLLGLITEKKQVAVAPQKKVAAQKKVASPQKKVVNMPSGKLTQKQLNMIFALAHKLNIGKEQLKAMSAQLYNARHLSTLDKHTASKFIDYLLELEEIKNEPVEKSVSDIYG